MVEVILSFSILIALLAIIAGILVLLWPRLLNYIVAIWLILYGVLQLTYNLLYPSFS